MKNLKIIFLILPLAFLMLYFSGCATVPQKEEIPAYSINGETYYPLISLCESRNIVWQYDTYAKTVTLTKDMHKINLRVGDALALVDGRAEYLQGAVDIYQGMIMVPAKFKEKVIDVLFENAPEVARLEYNLKVKKVVIDAGHGGIDPGAIGKTGLREKDVNLDIAKRLRKILEAEGIEVVMTRSTDIFVPLPERVNIANDSGADLFISIHSNANRVKSMSGFEVYYVSSAVSDTTRASSAAKTADLNFDSACFASRSNTLKTILWDMIYTSNRAESIELSRSICKAIDGNLDVKILGVKGARYVVLKGARMPAVLIEVGFLSNSAEEKMLKNGFYRQKIAENIVQGIGEYSQDYILSEASKR